MPEPAFGGVYAAWVQGLHPEDAARAQASIASALRAEQEYRPEFRVRWPDGTIRHIAAFGKVIRDAAGAPQRMVGVNWDITDLKRAREAAEQAAQAKSDFLAHMSHEIRTPMNGILGLAEIALHRTLSPESREDLTQIRQSATALLGILNDILDYSRIEAGQLRLEETTFDLGQVLATLRGFFARATLDKGLDLRIEAESDVPRDLLGDPLRVQQVLSNLVGNALKFTDRGGVQVRLTCTERDDTRAWLIWTVTDTGIGMDAETLARLFQPFTQGDSSIARRFGGTGLGLSISRHLVTLMGGTLTVDSTPGAGTTFTLTLDLGVAAAPAEAAESAQDAEPSFPGARVLVAEDQPLNQRVIRDLLRLLGVDVTLAGDGREALERLAAAPFDAVLMDIQMPEMDGLTATRRIRAHPAWAALPVIALTAGVTADERARMRQSGLDDLLPKPVTLAALREVLGRWLPAAARLVPTPDASEAQGEPGALLALPGFDLRRLRQIATGEDEVCRLLRQFANSVRTDVDAIAAALAAADPTAAGQLAHRLKGVAATVGALDVFDATAELEAALHADPGRAARSLARLRAAHAQALGQIARLPEPGAAEPVSAEGDPQVRARLLEEIRDLVAQRRFVSPAVRAALRAALPASAQPTYRSLVVCLDQLDYTAAEPHLAALGDADTDSGARHD